MDEPGSPGAVPAHLRAGIAILNAEGTVWVAMLDGWAAQQVTRLLSASTIEKRRSVAVRFLAPEVLALAERVERPPPPPAQVLLRWHVQQGIVPVPRSSKPSQLRDNLDLFDFEISDADMMMPAALDCGESEARDSDSPENGH